jgi:hypothetical protein
MLRVLDIHEGDPDHAERVEELQRLFPEFEH